MSLGWSGGQGQAKVIPGQRKRKDRAQGLCTEKRSIPGEGVETRRYEGGRRRGGVMMRPVAQARVRVFSRAL